MRCKIPIGPQPIPEKKMKTSMGHKTIATHILFLDLRLSYTISISRCFPCTSIVSYLFLGGEVIGNIEELTDFLRCLSLDHVRNSLATNIPETSIGNMVKRRFKDKLTEGV